MVMFALSKTADTLKLNTPFNICVIYLGFGAGLAVFMFTGFMKSVPIAIEEAAMIDGCNPLQIFFKVVFPILKPTMISTAILETMWVWNDYLLPTLVLDIKKYRTIPMAIQYFRGSYGRVEMGPMMACIMITVLPIIVMYLVCQKYIIDGVIAGAVKGRFRYTGYDKTPTSLMLIGVFYIRLLSSKPDPPSTVSTPGLSNAYCTVLMMSASICAQFLFSLCRAGLSVQNMIQ